PGSSAEAGRAGRRNGEAGRRQGHSLEGQGGGAGWFTGSQDRGRGASGAGSHASSGRGARSGNGEASRRGRWLEGNPLEGQGGGARRLDRRDRWRRWRRQPVGDGAG